MTNVLTRNFEKQYRRSIFYSSSTSLKTVNHSILRITLQFSTFIEMSEVRVNIQFLNCVTFVLTSRSYFVIISVLSTRWKDTCFRVTYVGLAMAACWLCRDRWRDSARGEGATSVNHKGRNFEYKNAAKVRGTTCVRLVQGGIFRTVTFWERMTKKVRNEIE